MIRRFSASICALFVLTAFHGQAQEAQRTPRDSSSGAQTAIQSSPVVVRLLGVSITEGQVLAAIDEIARRNQLPPQQMQQKDTLLFKDAVDNLIGLALLKNEGMEKKITVDQAKVSEAYSEVVKRFPSQEEFKKALIAQGMSEGDLRRNIEDGLLYQAVIDQAVKDFPAPTDAEIKKYYDENPKSFESQEQVHAAQVFLKVDPKAPPEKKSEAKRKLEALRAEIESKRITFAEAAARNSEDSGSAQNGGDLGTFPRGQLAKPFEDAAFSTKPGTLSPVIESPFGYHLIYVFEHNPGGTVPLEKAQAEIKSFLERQMRQEAIQKYVAGLRQKAKVETVMTEEEWNKRRAAQKR